MPYANSVTLLDMQGGPAAGTPVSARWWILWTTVGDDGLVDQQLEEGSAQFLLSTGDSPAVQFSFPVTTDLGAPYEYGLSLQDTDRVAQDIGWLFRSGRVPDPTVMPTDPIEVVADELTFADSDIRNMFPPMPFSAQAGITLTSITGMLGTASGNTPGGFDFAATGTTTITGVTVGFTYSGRMVLGPSSDVAIAATAVAVGVVNPDLVFTSGPSVTSAIEAAIFDAMGFFIVHQWGNTIISTIQDTVNAQIVANAGRTLAGGALPAGITLSIRTITVNDTASGVELQVRGALGAFGGVLSKLPVLGSGSGCPLQTLRSRGLAAGRLSLLRGVRDQQLNATDSGRSLIDSYYRHGPEISALMRSDRQLAASACATVNEITSALQSRAGLTTALTLRCKALARDLAARASP